MTTTNHSNEQQEALKPCPFCGAVPVLMTPDDLPAGFIKDGTERDWCKITHQWECFIALLGFDKYPIHRERWQEWNSHASVAAVEGDALSIPDEAISEVAQCAQAVLTALNVGDVQSGSPLHLKLREVMIAYRECGVVVGPVPTEALSKIAAMHHADTCDSLLIEGYACSCHVAVALRALQNTTTAASSPLPAEPPPTQRVHVCPTCGAFPVDVAPPEQEGEQEKQK